MKTFFQTELKTVTERQDKFEARLSKVEEHRGSGASSSSHAAPAAPEGAAQPGRHVPKWIGVNRCFYHEVGELRGHAGPG